MSENLTTRIQQVLNALERQADKLTEEFREHQKQAELIRERVAAARGVKMRLEQLRDVLGELAPEIAEYVATDLSNAKEIASLLDSIAEAKSYVELQKKRAREAYDELASQIGRMNETRCEFLNLALRLRRRA